MSVRFDLYHEGMDSIQIAKFKEQCLALLDHLGPEGLIITKHCKPLARVIPASADCKQLIGSMKGKLHVRGSLLSTGIKWDAEY